MAKPIKIAINGYGRIGRCILRALYEHNLNKEMQIVAINDLGDVKTNAYLTEYDSVYGHFNASVQVEDGFLVINGDKVKVLAERDPTKLPWKDLGVDVVFECTGLFTEKDKASKHIEAGARKVVISAPAGADIKTIVFGVNDKTLTAADTVISNGSCTTNCLAPLAKVLNDKIGIVSGLMTTIHSYTNDQVLIDVYHKDLRRARSATQSMIPTKTGAASALGLVLPELKGKLDGFAVRVPTISVSLVDLSIIAARDTSIDEINNLFKAASEGELKGILGYNDKPLVSVDFKHNPLSSIYEASQTKVIGRLVKVLSWYDNEWGFSCRMLDTAKAFINAK
jgi:glyceraldehyde 3-phosphate dehydrogenase